MSLEDPDNVQVDLDVAEGLPVVPDPQAVVEEPRQGMRLLSGLLEKEATQGRPQLSRILTKAMATHVPQHERNPNMWQLVNKPKTLKVTKSLAKEFAEMDPAPHDRPLSERRLQVYQRIFKAGGFRPVTWAKASCKETGGTYRVNGKHTSILLSGLDAMPEFFVTIEEYSCDTLEDVVKLYSTFDSKMMSRTASDINMSFAATIPTLSAISQRIINLSISGIAYHIWQEQMWLKQPAERAELLLEHPEFILWLEDLLVRESPRSNHMRRYPVVAAMFATHQKVKGPATDFWTAVRDETGSKPDVPDRRLAKFLTGTGVNSGSGVKRARISNPREFYVKCLHAWNAWRKGEPTNLKYYADKDVPSIK